MALCEEGIEVVGIQRLIICWIACEESDVSSEFGEICWIYSADHEAVLCCSECENRKSS